MNRAGGRDKPRARRRGGPCLSPRRVAGPVWRILCGVFVVTLPVAPAQAQPERTNAPPPDSVRTMAASGAYGLGQNQVEAVPSRPPAIRKFLGPPAPIDTERGGAAWVALRADEEGLGGTGGIAPSGGGGAGPSDSRQDENGAAGRYRAGAMPPSSGAPSAAEAFNPELAGLFQSAVERHPSVASQRASLRAAGVDVTAAWLTRLPTLSVQMNQYGAIALSRQVTANADLPLWTNGKIDAAIDRARANRQAQLYHLAATVLDLELQVNQYYHEAKRLGEREQVLARTLGVMGDMVASMQRRVAQEVSPLADLQLASTRRLQVGQQLDLTRAQRASALAHLSDLVMRDDLMLAPGFVEPGAWPRWDLPGLTERMIAVSPQRLQTEAEARVARDDARIAEAARLPGLFGSYSYDEIYKHRVGISVRMQTAGGFSEIFSAHAARLRQQAASLQTPVVEQDLKATASADLTEYDSARARDADARELASDSQKITDSYVRQFVSGRRTWLDVMNAVREAMQAELDAIDVRYAASASAMRLLLRAGDMRASGTPAREARP